MKIIAIGGSVTGLTAAAALADRGHEVLILEREAASPPSTLDDAKDGWTRPTVPQAAHSHAFASRGTNLLRDKLPDVYEGIVAAGAGQINLADTPPPMIDFERKPSDAELNMLLSRRSTFEWVLRDRALSREGVSVRSGATVRGLVAEGTKVTGVRLDDGTELTADLVLDTSGRKSAAAKWLAEAGLPVPVEESESCKITYYTRYYRWLSPTPPGPLNRGFGAGGTWDSYTAVLFLGDGDAFSISIGVLPDDKELKGVRDEQAFTAAILATPLLAQWVAPGNSEPTSPVYAMGGLDNSSRLVDPDANELTSGFYGLGDAVCTTNPAYGRGISLGIAHVFELADLLDTHPSVDRDQAVKFAGISKALLVPFLVESIGADRGRAGLWEATLNGVAPQMPPPGTVNFGTALMAAGKDAEVWRRVAQVMMSLVSPAEAWADDEIRERVGRALAGGPPPMLPGASRADLIAAVNGTTAQAA